MFQYQCTIFREDNMPGLKLIAHDKLLFTRLHNLWQAPLLMSVMYKRYNLYSFSKNLWLKYDQNISYIVTCDLYEVNLSLLRLVVEASSLWHCMFRYIGIVTRYRLDDPGIKFRWGTRFPAPVQTDTRAQTASYTVGTGSFLGGKVAEAWH